MSRMHHRREGYPFGSLVDFAPDSMGRKFIELSLKILLFIVQGRLLSSLDIFLILPMSSVGNEAQSDCYWEQFYEVYS